MDVIKKWKYEPISGNFYPRQFEFHPNGSGKKNHHSV